MDAAIGAGLRWTLAGTIVAYVVVMYVIGVVAQRRVKDSEDFLVAGRRLPLSLAWMTLMATWFGAGALLTAADEVRDRGVRAAALDPLGAGVCLLLAGMFVAGPMWREHLLTIPDLFKKRFGPASELICSLVMVPGYFGWIAAQFVALAGMLHLLFGMPQEIGLVLVAVIGTGYTLMGGMWSVTLTDAVQIVLVLVGLVVLAASVLWELGSGNLLAGGERLIVETPPEMRVVIPTAAAAEFWQWIAVFAIGALGNLPGQDLMQRIFAARSDVVARRACYIAGAVYLTFGLIPIGLGLSARILLEGPAERTILAALASTLLHPVVLVIFIIALMSAVLSTIDSAILSPAGVLAQNVFSKRSRLPLLTLNRWAVLLVAACSLAMAYAGEDAYSLLEDAYEIGLVSLLVPMLFALYTRPRSGRAAVVSMLLGAGIWLVHFCCGWEVFFEGLAPIGRWQIPSALATTAISLASYLVVEGSQKRKGVETAGV